MVIAGIRGDAGAKTGARKGPSGGLSGQTGDGGEPEREEGPDTCVPGPSSVPIRAESGLDQEVMWLND